MYKLFIFSEDPDKLIKFYIDVLGFKKTFELKFPRDYGYLVESESGDKIWIAKHSEVKGYNKDPFRHILNMHDKNIKKIYEKVKVVPGVEIIQEPVCMTKFNPNESPDSLVLTFLDPEGNCLQYVAL